MKIDFLQVAARGSPVSALYNKDQLSPSTEVVEDDGSAAIALWGGHECTVNRVGDMFFDQTVIGGHQDRIEDLDLFAGLGIRSLRYPVLWERVSPRAPDQCDWRWSDERLAHIRDLGMNPIVGLIHHGSGPRYTDLLDPAFANGLARHAASVAARYDWVRDWTPVNEPLTTARFSALYGHWYPHQHNERAFWTALLNQIDGVRLSMRAVRRINPQARLIQTEDLGHTQATPPLAEQAAFDNLRRWATWDLLCGRVTPDHPNWRRIAAFGLEDRLRRIADDPCPPDIIGLNHYLTSDRYLDHRIDHYPQHVHGRTPLGAVADVEAVRVLADADGGMERAIRETWARYGLPIALTEVHNHCTREEQMRWFAEAWGTAQRLRADGIGIEAVTAWSLIGATDWDSLLTRQNGSYESGVFDLRAGNARQTAMAALLRTLAAGEQPDHPALAAPGWWRRDERLIYPPRAEMTGRRDRLSAPAGQKPLLITGATGTLGQALGRACERRALAHVLTDRAELPLDDATAIGAVLDAHRPWAVINAAGWVRVDDAEQDAAACIAANRDGAIRLARECARRAIPYTGFSSDLVFDGQSGRAYAEDDATAPLNVYGRSKADADATLLAMAGDMLVIRTAAFFSPDDPHNFAHAVVETLQAGRRFAACDDCVVSPTYVPDLVEAVLDLVIDGATGIWHVANEGAASWAAFARAIAQATGLDPRLIDAVPAAGMGWAAPRPAAVALTSRKGRMMPTLENAIARYGARTAHRIAATRLSA